VTPAPHPSGAWRARSTEKFLWTVSSRRRPAWISSARNSRKKSQISTPEKMQTTEHAACFSSKKGSHKASRRAAPPPPCKPGDELVLRALLALQVHLSTRLSNAGPLGPLMCPGPASRPGRMSVRRARARLIGSGRHRHCLSLSWRRRTQKEGPPRRQGRQEQLCW